LLEAPCSFTLAINIQKWIVISFVFIIIPCGIMRAL
jgi:hypothetical protein